MKNATKTQQESKTYRLCVGRLADGREAFAKAGYCISALGNYRYVDVWVRDRSIFGGMKLYRERNFAPPGSLGYCEMFGLIVKGRNRRVRGMLPLVVAQKLGWTKAGHPASSRLAARWSKPSTKGAKHVQL